MGYGNKETNTVLGAFDLESDPVLLKIIRVTRWPDASAPSCSADLAAASSYKLDSCKTRLYN